MPSVLTLRAERTTASVSTWLFHIAARLAMNEAARAHHAREVIIDGPDVASDPDGPDAALESLELGQAIEEATDGWPALACSCVGTSHRAFTEDI
ncbi:MAG: hypothetical protein ACYC6C_12595 [Coriobacteriia bacterium]